MALLYTLQESVQHFYDKLLLLKDTMNTEMGRQLAEGRHAFLKAFLRELQDEKLLAIVESPFDLSCNTATLALASSVQNLPVADS